MQKSKTIVLDVGSKMESQVFTVKKNEHLTLILIIRSQSNYSMQMKLVGENAEADILGIILGTGANEINLHTIQDHQAPNTRSNLLIKSALSGRSLLKYDGLIKVSKQAQKTNAYQRNENLMLSPEAKTETKPALEIIANDVRCTHSATISKVDPEQLFYLKSRGVSDQTANQLIIEGFFQSILEKIEDEKLKIKILKTIQTLFIKKVKRIKKL